MSADGLRKGENEVLLALAQGASTDQAGEAGGVSGRTVRRWLEDQEFRGEVDRLRAEILSRTVGALVDASVEAVSTLRAALKADSEQLRVRSAQVILSMVVAVRESNDFEKRLIDIEAAEAARSAQEGS